MSVDRAIKNYRSLKILTKKVITLRTGFEPVREDPNGFQVHRLNHSAIAAATIDVLFFDRVYGSGGKSCHQ